MPHKKDLTYLHELASSRGGRCLSTEYINSKTKYEWECGKCGYRWRATLGNVCHNGSWCPKCAIQDGANKKRKDIDWLHELASLRGGRCLSTEYINSQTKYQWECGKCGHGWWAVAGDVRQGKWCPECAGTKRKDINHLHQLASSRGGKCLSAEYINNRTKYEWECDKGHRWKAKANDVQQGKWCLRCSGKEKRNLDWLHELASLRGGRCLSTKYINVMSKYEWECKKKHKFKMMANAVQQGQWCPYCAHRHSKAEVQIYEFIKQSYSDTISSPRGLLVSPGLELDIYVPSLQKAIEFDGKFWHSTPEAKERDLRKDRECQKVGIELLRIQEQHFLDNPQQVFDMIKNFLKT